MSQKEQLLAMLAEYGVFSEADLDKALKKAKIDISVFVTPTEEVKHEV